MPIELKISNVSSIFLGDISQLDQLVNFSLNVKQYWKKLSPKVELWNKTLTWNWLIGGDLNNSDFVLCCILINFKRFYYECKTKFYFHKLIESL